MKTRDVIKLLQAEDPEGEGEVILWGTGAVSGAEACPGYYDGLTPILLHDSSKEPYYSIVGIKYTDKAYKVKLFGMHMDDVLLNDTGAIVDLSDIPEGRKKQAYLDRAANYRKDYKAMMARIDREIAEDKVSPPNFFRRFKRRMARRLRQWRKHARSVL